MATSDFPKSVRLTQRAEFTEVYSKGRKVYTPLFVAFFQFSSSPDLPAKMGVTATKKTANAVGRNSIKRRVRHLFRETKDDFPMGLRLVINAKRAFLNAPFSDCKNHWKAMMTSINKSNS